jgi:roadblock/LC7 domain-containing protein
MSNPTSNFNWQMPTNVNLVTDLPADFEVFGQAVDTSLADLKGGTTGQILSKATNTDMDFVWITNDQGDITGITATSPLTGGGTSGAVTVGIQSATTSQSGAVQLSDSTSTTSSVLAATPTAVKSAYDLAAAAIPKSTVTAKGSIVAATASSTPANLAVGTNFAFLQADSSTATGLLWDNAAWTIYTPTVTAGSGSFTTVTASGRYKRIGKLCCVQIDVNITTNGTAAASVIATLPFTAIAGNYTGVFRETNVTGTVGFMVAGGASATYLSFASGYPGGSGYGLKGSVTYEVA